MTAVRRPRSHRTGQSWLTTWTPQLVAESADPPMAFAEYAQQTLGVAWTTVQDEIILRKRIEQFFNFYPQADYYTLCRVVSWCKAKHRRHARVWNVVDSFRDAWVSGALPELDTRRPDRAIEEDIEEALQYETDPTWRTRLVGTVGVDFRRAAFAEWKASHREVRHGVH